MSVKINYSKNLNSKKTANLVLFSNEKFNTRCSEKIYFWTEISYVNDLLKTSDSQKENFCL